MDVTAILALHSGLTERWHVFEPAASGDEFLNVVSRNHLENFNLWHEEDIARCDHLGAEQDTNLTLPESLKYGMEITCFLCCVCIKSCNLFGRNLKCLS